MRPADPPKPMPDGRAVYLETFGCQMNVLDSQLVRSSLAAAGYRFTDDWQAADVVLYNTCSVREKAEQKVWSRLGRVGQHKRDRPDVILGVLGCMAEREGDDMIRRHPQVDLLCGPGELDKVPLLIDNLARTSAATRGGLSTAQVALQGNTHRRSGTLAAAEDTLELLDLSRSFDPDGAGSAYVRITRGCNKFCTYCVVPHTRGAEVHRHPDAIVEECRRLIEAGAREITLLGQTVNHYHYDLAATELVDGVAQPQVGAAVRNAGNGFAITERRKSDEAGASSSERDLFTFAMLLARVHDELPELQRLRFVTSFPRDFGDDILHTIAERPRLCPYLHLPVQSGSDRVLARMNRGYKVAEYVDLIDRARAIIPDVEIASDIITGFPTETEEDHRATLELIRRCRFKNSFIFKYSPRPGTAANERFADDVPNDVKKRRNAELLAVQSEVAAAEHGKYVGRTVSVFVEKATGKPIAEPAGVCGAGGVELRWESRRAAAVIEQEPDVQLGGRTSGDLIVCFDGPASLIGQTVEVRVDRAAPLTLFGERVEP
ncbi:MAG: MiaB/RimO family radical SAM methylthiotransferase [Planctomycetota bacterium]